MRTTKELVIGMLFLGISLLFFGMPAMAADILQFEKMAPVPENGFPIRGVAAAGRPWVVDSAVGRLGEDGNLQVSIRGLVLTNTGVNPAATFGAVVSCIVTDEFNFVDVATGRFAANELGDADIEETLVLPTPCFAPLVFITSPTGSWFAVSGGSGS